MATYRTEKQLEAACVRYAAERGWLGLKIDGPGRTHYPDRLFVHPHGQSVFVEFKTPKGRLRPGQVIKIGELVERGFCVAICNDYDQFCEGIRGDFDFNTMFWVAP